MPFVDTTPLGATPQLEDQTRTLDLNKPIFLDEVLPAAYQTENTVGSAASVITGQASYINPDVVPNSEFKALISGYENYAASFSNAETYDDFYTIKRNIDRELANRQVLNDAGGAGVGAMMAVSIVDPINLLPSSIFIKSAKTGQTIARTAAGFAAGGAIAGTAAELALQPTQETRTFEESALNIAASTIFSGILGAGGGIYKHLSQTRKISDLEAAIKSDLNAEKHYTDPDIVTIDEDTLKAGTGSVGAASTKNTTLEQETLKSALGLEKALSFEDPILRSANSPNIETRRVMQELAETPLMYEKNAEGIENPVAVETLTKMWQSNLNIGLTKVDDAFIQYREGRPRKTGDILKVGVSELFTNTGKLTRREFYTEVSKAMRRGDKHKIPEVQEAAQSMRRELFDPLKKRAIELGLLPENVTVDTADSYLTRLYNQDKIIKNRPEFEGRIVSWLEREQKQSTSLFDELEKKVEFDNTRHTKLTEDVKVQKDKAAKATQDYKVTRTKHDKLQRDLVGSKKQVKKLKSEIATQQQRADTLKTKQRAKEALANVERLNKTLEAESAKVSKLEDDVAKLKKERANQLNELRGLNNVAKNLEVELNKLIREMKSRANKLESEKVFPSLSKEELEGIAQEITDTILGHGAPRTMYQPFALKRGPLKERTLGIPDVEIEDYLENNIESIARVYTQTMAPDIELTARFGDTELGYQIDQVRDHYAQLRTGTKDPKTLAKLDKLMKREKEDIEAVRDRIRGTFALPTTGLGLATYRAGRFVKTLNYVRLLGGMTLSAIPDLGRSIMKHGMARTVQDGIIPLIKNFKQAKLSAQEVKLSGSALDMVLDTRAMQLADIFDDYGRMSVTERGLQALSQKFGIVSLMAPWNAALKQFNGIIAQTRTLQEVQNWTAGKIANSERERLAFLGISESMSSRITKEFKAHGKSRDGILWANTSDWADREAAQIYHAALAKEVDKTVVTPGQDKPLWMSTPLGSVIGQFKSFAISSTQRILLSGLQQRDAAALNGTIMMVGLGMLSTYIKNQTANRPSGDTVSWWIKEGFDRSGVIGWLFDAHNTVEKLTRGAVGLSQFTGGPMMSRYQSRNALGALLGPSAGVVSDVAMVAGDAANGEWTSKDTRAIRRLLPYQNLFYLRQLFDELEEGLNNSLGVKK